MTETQLRNLYVNTAKKYLGYNEGDGTHKIIVDLYNSQSPLPVGYKVTYTDEWCATFTSAVAWECGLTDIIFPECSCRRMLNLYKKAGRWEESDSYTPKVGDLILYDWEDNSSGDNTGTPNHVGIVTACSGGTITVLEGNKGDAVAYRTIKVNAQDIRGFCLPNYSSKAVNDTSNAKRIWDYFMDKLGNEYGVAGLMGNLEAESGLYPDRLQGDIPYSDKSKEYTANVDNGTTTKSTFVNDSKGYGLAQWTYYSRKQGLYDMWKSGDYSSIGSLDLGCDYLWYELTTSFKDVLNVLKNATTVRQASDKVYHDFESPKNHEGNTTKEEERCTMCQAWYDKYSGSTPGSGSSGAPWRPRKNKMSLLLMVVASQRRGM